MMMAEHSMIHQFPALTAAPAGGISKTFLVLDFVVKDADLSYCLPQLYLERVCVGRQRQ